MANGKCPTGASGEQRYRYPRKKTEDNDKALPMHVAGFY